MKGAPDLLVVGGGPAGLCCAIAARLRGLSVRVLEARRPPLDKACGEGLMPDGRRLLAELGVMLPEHRDFHGILYVDGALRVEGRFPAGHAGAGVRRVRLHAALQARAEELGVEILWGVRAQGLSGLLTTGASGSTVETSAGNFSARWVVAADGLHSKLRGWAGLAGPPAKTARFGVRRHLRLAPWSDLVEVHWGAGAELYLTPVAAEELGVAVLWSGRKASFDSLLAGFPTLAARLAGAEKISADRGAGPFEQRVRGVSRGQVHLLGDAGGYLDAITGEGLSLAFHQAVILAELLAAERPELYAGRVRKIAALPLLLTRLTLLLERHPALRARVFRALAAEPGLFDRFLAVHCRASAPSSLLAPGFLASFLRRFLWPGEGLSASRI